MAGQTTLRTRAPRPSVATRKAGYGIGAAVNALLLGAVNQWPGWDAVPFLTQDTTFVLGWVNASIVVALAANLLYAVADPPRRGSRPSATGSRTPWDWLRWCVCGRCSRSPSPRAGSTGTCWRGGSSAWACSAPAWASSSRWSASCAAGADLVATGPMGPARHTTSRVRMVGDWVWRLDVCRVRGIPSTRAFDAPPPSPPRRGLTDQPPLVAE
jgi:hypothetical protein